jgi:uncharacterized protein
MSEILAPITLGEAIRLLQARAGLNRDEMSRLARVSSGAMSNYVNDVSAPSASVLRRIANVLAGRLALNPAVLWIELGHLLDEQRGGQTGTARRRRQDWIVDQFERSLTVDDLESFFDLHSDDIVVHMPGQNPLAGEHKGGQAARALFTKLLELTGETARFDVHDILADDEHTVLLLTLHARRKDRVVYFNTAMICHLRDGKIAEAWIHPEDQYAADAFWSD